LSNNKPQPRQGKVQLIDASQMFRKLRKNLGNKNCEFAPEHIDAIVQSYLHMATLERTHDDAGIAAKVFDNQDFWLLQSQYRTSRPSPSTIYHRAY
jgi:type I restriction enzyme M protein